MSCMYEDRSMEVRSRIARLGHIKRNNRVCVIILRYWRTNNNVERGFITGKYDTSIVKTTPFPFVFVPMAAKKNTKLKGMTQMNIGTKAYKNQLMLR